MRCSLKWCTLGLGIAGAIGIGVAIGITQTAPSTNSNKGKLINEKRLELGDRSSTYNEPIILNQN